MMSVTDVSNDRMLFYCSASDYFLLLHIRPKRVRKGGGG